MVNHTPNNEPTDPLEDPAASEPARLSIAERALKLRMRAADVIENHMDAFVALDPEWRIVYANRRASEINHRPLDASLGKTHWEEWPASVGSEVERQYRRAVAENIDVHFEHHYVSDETDVWLAIDAYPSEDGINLFYRDITLRKAAEQELLQFQFLSDRANDVFLLIDYQGRFVYVNDAACRSLGYTAEQFQNLSPHEVNPTFDEVKYRDLCRRAEMGNLPPFESVHRRQDGSIFPVEASVSTLRVGGKPLLFSSSRDITERKRAEEDLLESVRRQQSFLRDVLVSVTDGHLILCDSLNELPDPLTPFSEPIYLSIQGGLRELRHEAMEACKAGELPEERCYDLLIATNEAGMNTIVHVGEGIAQIFLDKDKGVVQVCVVDHGKGISLENLPHATLRKGYSSAGTLGHGMKMMLQAADHIFLLTRDTGTTVVIEQGRVGAPVF